MARELRSTWTTAGEGRLHERRHLGIWFYRRTLTQKWTPIMHEIEREFGVRIGHVRLGLSMTVRRFFDGKAPAEVKGGY